ncbi:hypothetical protein N9043_01965 [bacterium]|nr:hypothetical protein [bacterium]
MSIKVDQGKVAEGAKEYILQAIAEGYEVKYKLENGYYWHKAFEKENRRVWQIREGWQTANLIDGRYTNHEKFDNLANALKRGL